MNYLNVYIQIWILNQLSGTYRHEKYRNKSKIKKQKFKNEYKPFFQSKFLRQSFNAWRVVYFCLGYVCRREELVSERIEQKAVGDRAICYCDSEACAVGKGQQIIIWAVNSRILHTYIYIFQIITLYMKK